MIERTAAADQWFAYRQPAARPAVRLFCFPLAGKGASTYRDYQAHLPEDVEVCPLQYPGRENRLSEPPPTDMAMLLDQLEAVVEPLLDLPYALFGHSAGALVAYELARRLVGRGHVAPLLLAVSSEPAPHLIEPHPLPNDLLTEEEFLADPDRLRADSPLRTDPELRALMLPTYRADSLMVERYRHAGGPPLALTIRALRGRDDAIVSAGDMAAWRQHTTGDFELVELPGTADELFGPAAPAICDLLAEELV